MLSDKSRKTVKACRFCWMCRHLCPVGLTTGRESNGPRAKALFLSLMEKGLPIQKEAAQDMYECALCNACASNCETGYEPAAYIRDARAALATQGLVPEKVQLVIDALLKNGNLYGEDTAEAVKDLDRGSDGKVLLYAGASAAIKSPENLTALMNLLEKSGVAFKLFLGANSSGAAEYDLLGDIAEVRDICAVCAKAINAEGKDTLVVLNPSDAVMFKQNYPAWGIPINARVVTATAFAAELVRNGSLKPKRAAGIVTYHDPCRLARDLEETEPARELIEAMGYTLKEMFQSRKITKCCGGEVLAAHAPELVQKMACNRKADAERTGAELLITACPGCSAILSSVEGMEVKDLFVLLDSQTN